MTPLQPAMPPEVPTGRSARSWIELITAVVGFLTAVLSLGIAAFFNNQRATAQEQVDQTRAEVRTLQRRLNDAEQENAALRTQLGSTSTASAAPSSPDSSATPEAGIWHSGTATVAPSVAIDLDALPSDPQWGMLNDRSIDEFHWAGPNCKGICNSVQTKTQKLIVDGSADSGVCATRTGYTKNDIQVPTVRRGLMFCVLTTEGRFSVVRVKQFTGLEAPLVVDITTYKKTGD